MDGFLCLAVSVNKSISHYSTRRLLDHRDTVMRCSKKTWILVTLIIDVGFVVLSLLGSRMTLVKAAVFTTSALLRKLTTPIYINRTKSMPSFPIPLHFRYPHEIQLQEQFWLTFNFWAIRMHLTCSYTSVLYIFLSPWSYVRRVWIAES